MLLGRAGRAVGAEVVVQDRSRCCFCGLRRLLTPPGLARLAATPPPRSGPALADPPGARLRRCVHSTRRVRARRRPRGLRPPPSRTWSTCARSRGCGGPLVAACVGSPLCGAADSGDARHLVSRAAGRGAVRPVRNALLCTTGSPPTGTLRPRRRGAVHRRGARRIADWKARTCSHALSLNPRSRIGAVASRRRHLPVRVPEAAARFAPSGPGAAGGSISDRFSRLLSLHHSAARDRVRRRSSSLPSTASRPVPELGAEARPAACRWSRWSLADSPR